MGFGGDDVFTRSGFINWKKTIEEFNEHVGGVGSAHNEARIQFEGFKNQRQSVDSECSEVAAVVGMNAPGNNQMIASKIQKQLVNACAVETTNVILADLGDRWFTLLLDEARDCSVKEQMTVVIRYAFHVATTTAACLKEAIDSLFAKYDVLQNLIDDGDRSSKGLSRILVERMKRNSFSRFDVQKLVRLAHFYKDDFSWNERMLVEQELETYIDDVRSDERFEDILYLGALAKKMIETMKNRVFPLIYRMIELTLLLPIATAIVERVFSAMNIVKTNLRNRIGDEWMNDSLVVYIEKDVFNTVDNESILQRFQNMESRRMQLSRIR
ncbi:uncharacterized protein LOC122019563 [Zingiber officinale]|uniref:uncharacterized protein LOC122019563 n=1 Tax=Zingiber officinale TaxID=94328 RepID=UPI001C4D846A|nr:uncharacterized protein LOC122019563 [Zingiber officinale]